MTTHSRRAGGALTIVASIAAASGAVLLPHAANAQASVKPANPFMQAMLRQQEAHLARIKEWQSGTGFSTHTEPGEKARSEVRPSANEGMEAMRREWLENRQKAMAAQREQSGGVRIAGPDGSIRLASVGGMVRQSPVQAVVKSEPAISGRSPYDAIIAHHAAAQGVPLALAHAVIQVESSYRASARGAAGEIGLMQIKPATARMMGYSGSAKGLYDPEINIRYGMKYLGEAHRLAGGSTCGTILKYNAGHGAKSMNPISANYCKKVQRMI